MRNFNQFFDKLFSIIPGYIFGVLAFTFGFLGNILALLFSPDYHMLENSISMLGLQTGGIFLRLGLIISNIFTIPFVVFFGRTLKDENINKLVRKLAIGSGIFTSVSVILTGVFTSTNPLVNDIHGLFALLSFIGGALVISIYTFLVVKNPKFSKSIMYTGIVISGIVVSYLILFFITNFCNFFQDICFSLGELIYIIMPLYEWTMIFAILLWYLSNSIYMAKLKL